MYLILINLSATIYITAETKCDLATYAFGYYSCVTKLTMQFYECSATSAEETKAWYWCKTWK